MSIICDEDNNEIIGKHFSDKMELMSFHENIKSIERKGMGNSTGILEIRDLKFTGCSFEDIDLVFSVIINCEFENCLFKDIDLENSDIKNCVFHDVVIYNTRFNTSSIIECSYVNSIISKSNFNYAILKKCSYLLSFYNCELYGTQFLNNYKQFEINFEPNDNSLVGFNTIIDKYKEKTDEKIDEWTSENMKLANDIDMTYYEFTLKFKQNNVMSKYGELFYLYKRANHKKKNWIEKIISNLYSIFCGYGEKPHRALISGIVIIFLSAILYSFSGLNTNEGILKYSINLSNITNIEHMWQYICDFKYFLYFSIVTFTTVGYGNMIAINWGMLVSSVEMILGVVLVGLFISTLVRVMSR